MKGNLIMNHNEMIQRKNNTDNLVHIKGEKM